MHSCDQILFLDVIQKKKAHTNKSGDPCGQRQNCLEPKKTFANEFSQRMIRYNCDLVEYDYIRLHYELKFRPYKIRNCTRINATLNNY